ncbi:helix-turn-helix transcriptional regulator [Solibacillus silvestris]|uniref:helix-turn-helix transcriptional regulator n=1 Tax=Solibacillus silvestris TaxID=76853 RepID=UPI003F801C97
MSKQAIFLDSNILRNYLKINGISEAEFAKNIGVAHSTVNRVLNGKRNPGGKFISGVLTEYKDLSFNEVFIFDTDLPKGNKTA